MLWFVPHGTRESLSLAAGSQARMTLDLPSHDVSCWVSGPIVLSDLPLTISPLPHTLLPFNPQWLSHSSDLIIHTSLRVPTVSEYQVSSAACLGFVPGNRNPNHTVRGFILLSWTQYTTLWQGKTHLEKNRLYTWMWTCHKIHSSFHLKLPLLKRSPYHAVWQHKALRRKRPPLWGWGMENKCR